MGRADVKKRAAAAERSTHLLKKELVATQALLEAIRLKHAEVSVRLDAALMEPLGYGYVKADKVAEVVAPFARFFRPDGVLNLRGSAMSQFSAAERSKLYELFKTAVAVANMDESRVTPLPPAGAPSPSTVDLTAQLLLMWTGGIPEGPPPILTLDQLEAVQRHAQWQHTDEDDNERFWNTLNTGHAYQRHDGRPLKYPVPKGVKP